MKAYIMLALYLLLAYNGSAQVEKYKAFQSKCYDPQSQKSTSFKWNDVSILVVLNLTKNKLHIYSESQTDIDILQATQDHTDEYGNIWIKYKGIDESGLRCDIEWVVYKDQSGRHKYTIILEYNNLYCYYRLEED